MNATRVFFCALLLAVPGAVWAKPAILGKWAAVAMEGPQGRQPFPKGLKMSAEFAAGGKFISAAHMTSDRKCKGDKECGRGNCSKQGVCELKGNKVGSWSVAGNKLTTTVPGDGGQGPVKETMLWAVKGKELKLTKIGKVAKGPQSMVLERR